MNFEYVDGYKVYPASKETRQDTAWPNLECRPCDVCRADCNGHDHPHIEIYSIYGSRDLGGPPSVSSFTETVGVCDESCAGILIARRGLLPYDQAYANVAELIGGEVSA